jgi:hypothetical protein
MEKSLKPIFSLVSDMSIKMAPSIDKLLLENLVPSFVFQEKSDVDANNPVVYFHTSGSLGISG